MAIELINKNGESKKIDDYAWDTVLALAEEFGWRPMGTLPPPLEENPEEWDKADYYSQKGQTVTAEDAHLFSVALERSLEFIPGAESEAEEAGVRLLRELSDFCQRGEFEIR